MVLWNTWDILYVTVLVSWSIPSPCSCYIPRGGTPFSHEVTSKFPRSRVQNISKNHPRFFSHWIAGAAPAGIKISASSLPRLEKSRETKKNARWREQSRPKKLQTVLLLHNGTGRGATSCCKTETKLFQQRQHLPNGWSPAGLRRNIMFLTSDCLDMWVRTVRELTSGLLEMSERAPRRSRREMNWWRSSMTADQAVWYQPLFPQRHLQSFYIKGDARCSIS